MSDRRAGPDVLPRIWDPQSRVGDMLRGLRGLVVGIANRDSIAFGCASKLRGFGAELAVTYLNEKAERFVRPLAEDLGAELILPLDVEQPGQMEAVFDRLRTEWGRLDFVVHSIAFAPRAPICMAAWSIARRPDFCRRWRCPAIPSSPWRALPSR